MLDVLSPLVSEDTLGTIKPPLLELAELAGRRPGARVGLLGALWSASGYVGAFGRAMNRIYEIGEGRPFWKLRPLMLLITLVAIVLVALVMVMLVGAGRWPSRSATRSGSATRRSRSGTSPSGR